MNALEEAIKTIDNLNKRVKYLENHLTLEAFDEYCEWLEESGLKKR